MLFNYMDIKRNVMVSYIPQIGDIIFKDSQQSGAKAVKFLMTAPTVFHHIARAIKGTQEKVEYYHPLMVFTDVTAVEQQWKVAEKDLADAVNGNRVIVFRRKGLNPGDRGDLFRAAYDDKGQYWGVVHTLFGKFPTWLTGIPYFGRYLKLPNEEVSALRVARWFNEVFGETFGSVRYTDTNSHLMVKYMKAHPEVYEVVYVKD